MASLIPRSGVLGLRDAAHLLRRATFGVEKPVIDQFAGMTVDQALVALMQPLPAVPPPLDPKTGASWVVNGRVNGVNSYKIWLRQYVIGWWLQSILDAPAASLQHKMEFFLHTRFTTDMYEIEPEDNYYTLLLFRQFALGNYRILARKICLDNGMLRFLDTHFSRRTAPNENFPREFLELFTIGKGPLIAPGNYTHYTEEDIKAASRLLTGFQMNHRWWDSSLFDPDTGLPAGTTKTNSHDSSDKIFSDAFVSPSFPSPVTIKGKNSNQGMLDELDAFVDMVFAKEATAFHIVRKLYQYFVHYEITPEVETDIISPLATQFFQQDYNLAGVVSRLLKSEHFYDIGNAQSEKTNRGAMVKSPLSLLTSTIRFFGVNYPKASVDLETHYLDWHKRTLQEYLLPEMGMQLFSPPTVAGYPPYHQEPNYNQGWVNANTLPFRYNLATMLLSGKRLFSSQSIYMSLDTMALVTNSNIVPPLTAPDPYDGVVSTYAGGRFAEHLVRSLIDYVFPEPLSADRMSYFLDDLLLDHLSPINWRMEWVNFEMTGDASSIRPQLETLIRGIIQSPEYQLE